VQAKFNELAGKTGRSAEVVAEGFINIAVQQMANAIKKISVARGYDVTRYTLQCFGGAGAACLPGGRCAGHDARVRAPAGGRAQSAYGMGLADQNVIREQAVEMPLAAARCRRCREAGRPGRGRPGTELGASRSMPQAVQRAPPRACALCRAAIRPWSCLWRPGDHQGGL
jgi:N-methylhydantoinase A/oxoprolinase/acetone carboxylase beta subunit